MKKFLFILVVLVFFSGCSFSAEKDSMTMLGLVDKIMMTEESLFDQFYSSRALAMSDLKTENAKAFLSLHYGQLKSETDNLKNIMERWEIEDDEYGIREFYESDYKSSLEGFMLFVDELYAEVTEVEMSSEEFEKRFEELKKKSLAMFHLNTVFSDKLFRYKYSMEYFIVD